MERNCKCNEKSEKRNEEVKFKESEGIARCNQYPNRSKACSEAKARE